MVRLILYIILTFIIFTIFKLVLNIFRRKTYPKTPPSNVNKNKESEILDKSKIVDADFEEIK